jgi:hypothetical protein
MSWRTAKALRAATGSGMMAATSIPRARNSAACRASSTSWLLHIGHQTAERLKLRSSPAVPRSVSKRRSRPS